MSLPLIAGHLEVGAQRPPDVAGVDTILDGLYRSPPAELRQNVVHHDRGTANCTELAINEFAKLRQPHAHETTQTPR